ncbi:hypothetical protein TSUD_181300 [Trifolium subterraneum]|uniref:Reverse transcriptase zinc-binding domain-containing protein n=1 Tax=Trifolium subterraneum TaxID=3900 RepID=A0A2Z6LWR2_TRISU|nr:hypothetical protein TSUD_181300 [Trifolium subterraneum]
MLRFAYWTLRLGSRIRQHSDPDNGYSVRSAYHLLTFQDSVSLHAANGLIWHPQVPMKVSILAWRLLRDRLPTKANLVTRGILSPEAHFCVSGCGAVESAQHLFLSCSTFGPLWHMVSSWIGSPLVDSHTIPDHFAQFTLSGGGSRGCRSFMQLIWLVSVWVVWNERNSRCFSGSTNSLQHMLDKIKNYSYRPSEAEDSSTSEAKCFNSEEDSISEQIQAIVKNLKLPDHSQGMTA